MPVLLQIFTRSCRLPAILLVLYQHFLPLIRYNQYRDENVIAVTRLCVIDGLDIIATMRIDAIHERILSAHRFGG